MNSTILTLLLAAAIAMTACGGPTTLIKAGKPGGDTTVSEEEKADMSTFCNEFARVAAATSPAHQNTLVSPLSAYYALAMAAEGAAGNTRAEFDAVMGTPDGQSVAALTNHLSSLDGTTLNIANSVWLDEGFTAKETWLGDLSKNYLAAVFQTELDTAVPKVNGWIEDKTNDLIKNMLAEGDTAGARALIINAIYLDAEWQSQFDANATVKGRKFTNFDGGVSIADYLYAKRVQSVIDTDDLTGVVLPYSDGNLAFVAVMADDASIPAADVTAMVADAGGYAALADTAAEENIKLYLPKFEHEASLSLVDVLTEMGIETAFTGAADFSGIAEEPLCISNVLQNAYLRVDEEGTEAAAATIVMMKTTSAFPGADIRTIDFCRPFTFAVVDRTTGAVLFCGEHNIA